VCSAGVVAAAEILPRHHQRGKKRSDNNMHLKNKIYSRSLEVQGKGGRRFELLEMLLYQKPFDRVEYLKDNFNTRYKYIISC